MEIEFVSIPGSPMQDRNRQIIELAQQGIPYAKIAKQFYMTRQRVSQIANEAGIRRRNLGTD